mmetsp:Transcript_12034/g.29136  ORF Transcript_12034/g.29136 Transcript_12034/m.29136 type:complete len:622 (+) Transcript_12034:132-1997(+)
MLAAAHTHAREVEEKLSLSQQRVCELETQVKNLQLQHEMEQATLNRKLRTLKFSLGAHASEQSFQVSDLRDEVGNLERRNFELRMQKDALENEVCEYIARLDVSEEFRCKFDKQRDEFESEFGELWAEKMKDFEALKEEKELLQEQLLATSRAGENAVAKQEVEAVELQGELAATRDEAEFWKNKASAMELSCEEQAEEAGALRKLLFDERDRQVRVVKELKEEYSDILKPRACQYLEDMDLFTKIQDRLMQDLTTERYQADARLLSISDRVQLEREAVDVRADMLARRQVDARQTLEKLHAALAALLKKLSLTATKRGSEEFRETYADIEKSSLEAYGDDAESLAEHAFDVLLPRLEKLIENAVARAETSSHATSSELVCARACLSELEDENSVLQDENQKLLQDRFKMSLDLKMAEQKLDLAGVMAEKSQFAPDDARGQPGGDNSSSSTSSSAASSYATSTSTSQIDASTTSDLPDYKDLLRGPFSSTATSFDANKFKYDILKNSSRAGMSAGGAAPASSSGAFASRHFSKTYPSSCTREDDHSVGAGEMASKWTSSRFRDQGSGGAGKSYYTPGDDVSTTLEENYSCEGAGVDSTSWVEKRFRRFRNPDYLGEAAIRA